MTVKANKYNIQGVIGYLVIPIVLKIYINNTLYNLML